MNYKRMVGVFILSFGTTLAALYAAGIEDPIGFAFIPAIIQGLIALGREMTEPNYNRPLLSRSTIKKKINKATRLVTPF